MPIFEIQANELGTIREGDVNNVTFNPLFKINGAGAGVSGTGLWKLGVWCSSSPAGEGKRVSYKEQVMKFHTLSIKSGDQKLSSPKDFGELLRQLQKVNATM